MKSSFQFPEYTSPFADVRTPSPFRFPLSHDPEYSSLFAYVWTPWPCFKSSSQDPEYHRVESWNTLSFLNSVFPVCVVQKYPLLSFYSSFFSFYFNIFDFVTRFKNKIVSTPLNPMHNIRHHLHMFVYLHHSVCFHVHCSIHHLRLHHLCCDLEQESACFSTILNTHLHSPKYKSEWNLVPGFLTAKHGLAMGWLIGFVPRSQNG